MAAVTATDTSLARLAIGRPATRCLGLALAAFLSACSAHAGSSPGGLAGGTGGSAASISSGTNADAAAAGNAANGGVLGNAANGTAASGAASGGGGSGRSVGAAGSGGAPLVVAGGYFVSPMGSDSAAGTMDTPFQTIEKARDVVRTVHGNMADDIHVYLRGGTYAVASTIAFGPQDSGNNGHRIFYEAYPGETPILNGATKVTGWMPSSGGVYKAQLSHTTKLRNLYVNDQRALLTSKKVTATGGYGNYTVTAGQAAWAWASGSNSDGAKYSLTDVPSIAKNKDDVEIVNATTWNENIVCVRDVITTSDNARALLFQQPYGASISILG